MSIINLGGCLSLVARLVITGLFLLEIPRVAGQTLATANFSGAAGLAGIHNSIRISVGYQFSIFNPSPEHPLFDVYSLSTANVGNPIVVTSQNETDFSTFIQLLTNGQPDAFAFEARVGFGGHAFSYTESQFFSPLPLGNNGIDFQGFSIGSLSLTLDRLTFDSPGTNPSGNGYWTDYSYSGTIAVYAVPEPSSSSFLTAGGLLLAAFRARARCS